MIEHPIPEQTDELAVRMFRAFFTSNHGRDSSVQTIDELQPGMAQVWRNMAIHIQDVLGIENVAQAMASMDNLATSPSRGVVEEIRKQDRVIVEPLEAAHRALGGAA